jgi:hypothetical protein
MGAGASFPESGIKWLWPEAYRSPQSSVENSASPLRFDGVQMETLLLLLVIIIIIIIIVL